MTIDTITISDIKPYEKNAKSHPKKQVDLLAENIKRFGFTTPCLVDKDNNLIAGHGRLEAVKTLGWTDVPCVRMENLTDDEVKALRLADNKLAEMSEWDMALVTDELKELDDDLLDLTGFDKDLIIEPDEADDEVPEVPDEPVSKLGDLYELGQHRVLCGDSTKLEDVERLMDGKKADMVFTDPPYRLKIGENGAFKKAHDKMAKDLEKIIDYDPNELFSILPVVFSSKTMNAFVFCNTDLVPDYCLWARENRYNFNILTWHKTSFIPAGGNHHFPDTEYLIYISKQPIFNSGLNVNYGKYWVINNEKSEDHPTIKPQEIITNELLIGSNISSIVVDFYLGSGSTLIACEQTDRTCYGMELDPKYIDVIVQRYVDYTGNATIKRNGEQITWSKTPTKTPQG